MSMNRLITRLSVVSALNNYMSAPWPTIAGPNIFDSKIEPVEDMKKDKAFPCIVVYTDYDKDHWNKGAGAHKPRMTTVTLELLIVQTMQVEGEDGEPPTYTIDCPFTDSEIETSLDIMETQIFRALSGTSEAADCFNYICSSYDNIISRRGASVEGGQRLAARQITMEMKANRDPVKGPIPEPVESFLSRLETFDDYAERVDDIRSMLAGPASDNDFERHRRVFGYPQSTANRLGITPGPIVTLPSNLTYHYEGLSP